MEAKIEAEKSKDVTKLREIVKLSEQDCCIISDFFEKFKDADIYVYEISVEEQKDGKRDYCIRFQK